MFSHKYFFHLPGLLLLIFLYDVPAIARPDFTGIWVRDPAQSDSSTAVVGLRSNVSRRNAFILKVHHNGRILQLEAEQDGQPQRTITHVLGRDWHGKMWYDLGRTLTSSKWKGDVLVIRRDAVFRGNFGNFGVRSEQEWVLSPDGRVLTVKTTASQNNAPEMVTREVFHRK